MASGRLESTWRHVCSLLGAASAVDTPDSHLLARYVAQRDDAAFAELVRRYSPLVHGVCRRVLTNPHDAEDAFQATFLILSHKAASIHKGDSLASWLHNVALRAAFRLRRNVVRRKEQTLPADTPQAERDDVSWREVQQLLDEELARLPERFRRPLILCYLEGRTRDEAAEELGWSLSTFRGRLERGRERLRRRLERRGLTLSAALLATLAARHADAALATTLTASAKAAALATEVMRTMFLAKVKSTALWCVAVLFLSVAVGAPMYRYVAAQSGASTQTAEPPKTVIPPTPPEEDGLVKDYLAHLDHFEWTLQLVPQDKAQPDKRYPLLIIQLHVVARRVDPAKSDAADAQITKEQAAKIIDVLAKDNFFRESSADPGRLPRQPKGSYAMMFASYGQEGPPQTVYRLRVLDWDANLVKRLEAIRQCVDGDAAKALDTMLKSLRDEREHAQKVELLKRTTAWIEKSLKEMQTVTVGTTREELLKVFTTEGGLSSRLHQTFVYRECPYIKVDVEFKPIEEPNKKLKANPKDTIIKISKPYLEWSIGD
jgi:RNA polymerase sigma factor (sigma-70 family)